MVTLHAVESVRLFDFSSSRQLGPHQRRLLKGKDRAGSWYMYRSSSRASSGPLIGCRGIRRQAPVRRRRVKALGCFPSTVCRQFSLPRRAAEGLRHSWIQNREARRRGRGVHFADSVNTRKAEENPRNQTITEAPGDPKPPVGEGGANRREQLSCPTGVKWVGRVRHQDARCDRASDRMERRRPRGRPQVAATRARRVAAPAKRHMASERTGHVLQATALVNEVYLRLVDIRRVQWQEPRTFSRWPLA